MTTNDGSNQITTTGNENTNNTPTSTPTDSLNNKSDSDSFYYLSKEGTYFTKYLNSSKDKLIFKLNFPEDKKHFYSESFSYQELIKICPLFTLEEDIEGINQLISESVNNFGIETSNDEFDENKKILTLKISINSKPKEFRLILQKTDMSDEDLISSLIDKINNLLNDRKEMYGVKSFKQVKNDLKNTKDKLGIKLDELETKLERIEKTFNTLKEISLIANSHIINDSEELKLILSTLKKSLLKDENKESTIKFKKSKNTNNSNIINKKATHVMNQKSNKNIIFKLVYRASRDGDSAEEFHKRCNDLGANITLVKTDKNIKFGGFTNFDWDIPDKETIKLSPGDEVEKEDDNAFCFSLSLNKIYLHNKDKKGAIFCCEKYGPIFSDKIFAINDNMLSKGGYCGKMENSNFIGQETDYEISGEEKFNIKELEVFEIIKF